jgi:DNA-binding CsgD family transcriptional regulator
MSMVSYLDIQDYFQKIEDAPSHEDQIIRMVRGITELFPFNNAYFFRYSPIGYLSEGVVYLNEQNIIPIKNIRDDLRSLPTILTAIQNRKSLYVSNDSFISHDSNFPGNALTPAMIILPICQSANVIGYIISTSFRKTEEIDENTLLSLDIYGKTFGKLIERYYNYYPITSLSRREIEVMQRLAYGHSTKEIAETMNISDHTVKDYIKSAVKKVNALNRLHAVVILIRKGIIT